MHQNPSSGSRVVPWGRMDWQTVGRTDGLDVNKSLFAILRKRLKMYVAVNVVTNMEEFYLGNAICVKNSHRQANVIWVNTSHRHRFLASQVL
jgi:hypothetical protein